MLILPRLTVLLAFLGALFGQSAARFGDAIEDKVSDSRFRNMGQAYISQFEIVDSTTKFQVVLEDTLNEPEYWVVDFQQYGAEGLTAVDTQTGSIHPENTGECSSVIFSAPYQEENVTVGYYFSDQGNFVSRNVSLTDNQIDGSGANKRLFTSYQRGSNFTEPDSDGNDIQRRNYVLSFDDDFGYFFNCTDTNGMNIWEFSNTTDTIEFRTTIYFTNVRPVDPTDGTKGMSWVTSSVDLFYRLNRVAIVNFIVSSIALVKPVLDFVIIDLYFPPATPTIPDTKKVSIEMQFQTTIESPNGELLALYNSTSFKYLPKNETAASFINFDLGYDFPNGTQQCQYVGTARCRQIWNFNFVLELDVVVTDDDMPIDATGTFKFLFAKYQCNDPTEKKPIDCIEMNVDPLTISLEVTIQTVVQVVDSTSDTPTIQLVSLTGNNGEDLRSGGGRRGVNHLEPVSIVVQYFPEFLRRDFDLELTLFMVCKSNLLSSDAGCLSAPQAQRYVAYSNANFQFAVETDNNGDSTTVTYDSSSLTNDNKVQKLTTNAYDSTNEVYNMGFTNTALSQDRLTYTITTVFRLVQKPSARRRRAIAARTQLILTSSLDGDVERMARGLMAYGLPRARTRRDIMEAVADPQGHIYTLTFNGCPANSTFNAGTYHCQCDRESERYSTESFTCQGPKSLPPGLAPVDVVEDLQEPDSGRMPSSGISTAPDSALFYAVLTVWFTGFLCLL
ncbi:uncharacterized protein LOC110976117 [Acanthaster planci]|uniref:Uncharacterized protein LOC110976117 n=1 Tax=Acanthaster planci TaxID=133434 RepID=A0A8B7XX40_ACAPL|nr:uncharacterized protein LOC110976117 [Acanthaster planci]